MKIYILPGLDRTFIFRGKRHVNVLTNSMVINNLIVMAYAYDLTGEKKYLNGVVTGMDYLLGCNPLAVTGIKMIRYLIYK